MTLTKALLIFGMVAAFPTSSFAHPTSYKGALGVMTWNQPWLTDNWVTYSFRHDMAFAARYMRMEMPEGRFYVYLPQYDILLKRWNGKEYQANIYAYAGFGGVEMNGKTGTTWLGGVEIDAESRKLFAAIKAEKMNPTLGPDFNHYELRLGVAPYEAEFNEIASWLMVQYQNHTTLTVQDSITPLGRFFYRNVLFEVGMSLRGEPMTNLMFHF